MDFLSSVFDRFTFSAFAYAGFRTLLILVFGGALLLVMKKALARLEMRLIRREAQADGEPVTESSKRIETIFMLFRQATSLAVAFVIGLMIFNELGIEIGPLIASAGIVGLAVGFGAQALVRDVISGFFIIMENQVRVGDVAMVNGTGGLVEQINFRTTILRDLTGTVHVFQNGLITSLSNLTNEWSAYLFNIGVAYKENTDRVIAVMQEVGAALYADEKFGKHMLELPEVMGVDKFDDSAVIIKGRIKTKPIKQWDVGREYLRRIKLAFDENNIEIPFPHRTVYFGGDGGPFQPSGEGKGASV